MRIFQLIDSLETGGAEKMAVSYANALTSQSSCSGIVATRKEGVLKGELLPDVKYIFANRKSVLDIKALFRVRKFIREHHFSVVHAHSSSFFFAILLKMVCPSLQIVWHDHYGYSDFLSERKNKKMLQFASLFFFRIITVNEKLKNWADQNLYCKKVKYIPNFVLIKDSKEGIRLKGNDGKRILCLANLRQQKNHIMLLDIARKIKPLYPEWTFHLVGKDFEDDYSAMIRETIISYGLQDTVFIYGSTDKAGYVINQSTIGILTSVSEGLPVSLLEYGYFGLPVVLTAVGEIPTIITEDNGILVNSGDSTAFSEALLQLMENTDYRTKVGANLKNDVLRNYTQETVIKHYLNFVENGK